MFLALRVSVPTPKYRASLKQMTALQLTKKLPVSMGSDD
jgi:hypothetical protein